MTLLELDRKTSGACIRCGVALSPSSESVLCDEHAEANRERQRRFAMRTRPLRRQRGVCVDCQAPCRRYRCIGGCERRRAQQLLALTM